MLAFLYRYMIRNTIFQVMGIALFAAVTATLTIRYTTTAANKLPALAPLFSLMGVTLSALILFSSFGAYFFMVFYNMIYGFYSLGDSTLDSLNTHIQKCELAYCAITLYLDPANTHIHYQEAILKLEELKQNIKDINNFKTSIISLAHYISSLIQKIDEKEQEKKRLQQIAQNLSKALSKLNILELAIKILSESDLNFKANMPTDYKQYIDQYIADLMPDEKKQRFTAMLSNSLLKYLSMLSILASTPAKICNSNQLKKVNSLPILPQFKQLQGAEKTIPHHSPLTRQAHQHHKRSNSCHY